MDEWESIERAGEEAAERWQGKAEPQQTLPLADLALWGRVPPTPKPFFLERFIPQREVTILNGIGGSNKSTFGLQLAICSAASLPILGLHVAPGPTLYLTAEDDDPENHWRGAKICEALGTSLSKLAGTLQISSIRGRLNNELATFDHEGRLRPAPTFAQLKATIAATKAKLAVLDNVAHLFAGNENDRGQVTAFINLLYQLCRDHDLTVVLIGHPNKSGDSYSGSTAWLNAVRSQVVLERPDDYDPDARQISIGKANYARVGDAVRFRWHDFALVRDEDLPTDTRIALAATIQCTSENMAFLACLRERASQGEARSVGPSPGPNYAPTQFEGMPQAKGLKKDALKAAMDCLFAIRKIETVEFKNKEKGRTVTVIRELPDVSPNASPNASRTDFPNDPEPAEIHPRTHTHNTTYYNGAAHKAAAPNGFYAEPVDFPEDNDPAVEMYLRGQ